MNNISKVVTRFSRGLDLIGGYFYFVLMILVVANVIMRTVFSKPILGTIEFVEIFTAVGIGLTIAYCAVLDEHISVDFVFEYLPQKIKKVISAFVHVLTLGFLGLAGYMVFQYGTSVLISGRVTPTLGVPYYPFLYIIAFGFIMYFLVAVFKVFEVYRKEN